MSLKGCKPPRSSFSPSLRSEWVAGYIIRSSTRLRRSSLIFFAEYLGVQLLKMHELVIAGLGLYD
ncbi:MAG: hypothetical protein NWE82_00580, partial [Candidatus Bathyarchaeota archaeon]|nr:hypothetical protein [Candidatus Bathyarchaeota archaeon]